MTPDSTTGVNELGGGNPPGPVVESGAARPAMHPRASGDLGGVTNESSGARPSSEALNLERISLAVDQHNANCPFPASEIRMNHHEIERLDWDEIRGLPIVPDPRVGTGCFRVICGNQDHGLAPIAREQIDEPNTRKVAA